MHDTAASRDGANLDYARVGHLPGRCNHCGFHTATQGHRDGCTPPAVQRTATRSEPPTESIQTARTAALAGPTRKAQINAYWQTGPIPPLPKTGDFIANCKTVDAAIALILQGATPALFDWTQPPTDKSVRHNDPARIRARWDALTLAARKP